MLRSFGLQTLTGSAQPLFADKITTGFIPPLDQSKAFNLVVANSAIYQDGDRIILGAGSAGANVILVIGQPTGTTLLCMSEGGAKVAAWPINTLIELDIACAEIIINAIVGNAGTTWLGSDNSVTNLGGGTAFAGINGGASFNLGLPQWNTIRTSEGWIAGTLNDKCGAVALVI